MKKIFSSLLILAGLFTLSACGGDDDNNTPPNNEMEKKITGKWNVTDLKGKDGEWTNIKILGKDYTWIHFKSNGAYSSKEFGENIYTGTWKANGNTVKCKSGDVSITYQILSLKGGKAHFKMSYDDEEGYIEMKAEKE